jgi:hypothetical protein
MGLETNHEQPR